MQTTERRWFRFANTAKDTAEVWIYGHIGQDLWMDEGVGAKDFAQELHDVKAPNILVHLNSPGGDIFEGVAIAAALREHPANITIKVEGLAASAASFLAMAGDQVVMSQGSMMMIHEASGVTMGNADDHRTTAALLDQLSNNIAGFYARKAGGSVPEWRARMETETWYDAEDAVKAGLADEVSSDQAPENHFNLSRFQHVPERFHNEGRRNASTDQERIQQIHDLAIELGAASPIVEAQNQAPVAGQEPLEATPQDRAADPLLARLRIELAEAAIA
jgi:ATP-dependent protease ClpP protease subunit